MQSDRIKMLPEWLRGAEPDIKPARRGGRPFFERTMKAVTCFLDETLFNETVSEKKGFMQKVDPRVKIAGTALLIVALSLKKGPLEMLPLAAFALVLAALSRMPPGAYLKRLAPPVLMTAAIAAPAALNLAVKGQPVLARFDFVTGGRFGLPSDVYLTRQGIISALGLITRVSVSLALVFLATFTTRPASLLKGLCSLLPGFAGTLAAVSYRYVFFLARRMEEFIMAYRSRTAGGAIAVRRARAWTGSRAAGLLLIALKLKDDLERAMEARGINYRAGGKAEKFRPGAADLAFVALGLGVWLI